MASERVMQWSELTPHAAGGVSVLLVTGPGALAAVRALAGGAEFVTGRMTLARLTAHDELVDEALVCVHDAEHIELHCHGSPPLVRRLGAELCGTELYGRNARVKAVGAPGREGELSHFDGQVARAWQLLPSATCESAARMLLDQAEGALERERARQVKLPAEEREREQLALTERSRIARYLIDPPRLLIAGPVNAGKSTLFNALLGKRRAITSGEAGTTRDLLREPAQLGEWPVLLVDSAGERELARGIERAGQDLGRRERRAADLVLWLQPPAESGPSAATRDLSLPGEGEDRVVVLPSRGDLRDDPRDAPKGALQPLEAPEEARAHVAQVVREALGLPARAWTPGAAVELPFD